MKSMRTYDFPMSCVIKDAENINPTPEEYEEIKKREREALSMLSKQNWNVLKEQTTI